MPQQPSHSETQTEIHNLQALVSKGEIELEQLDEIRRQVKNRIRNCKKAIKALNGKNGEPS